MLVGLVGQMGSPGPKFSAGTPSAANRATSVQPSLALTSPADRGQEPLGRRRRQARARAGRRVGDVDVEAVEHLAQVRRGARLVRGPARTGS